MWVYQQRVKVERWKERNKSRDSDDGVGVGCALWKGYGCLGSST